jgi:predicted nucleic acid-binding Zn ribbon protein
MKQSAIAAVIERDLLRSDDSPLITTVQCFSCGYGMTYRRSRFCSDRCREWFDAGNPSFEDQRQSTPWDMRPLRAVAGPRGAIGTNPWQTSVGDMRPGNHGFHIRCAGCQKEFESKGLRCCSADCERRYRERQDNLKLMAEAGIEPAIKRKCEACGAALPKWSKGRLSKKRFCSARCQKAQRRTEMAPDGPNPVLSAET